MNTKLNGKLKKSLAVVLTGAFLMPPFAMSGTNLGAATASAQEYPGNYQGYPDQGYPGDQYGPPPADNRYGPPPSDYPYTPPPADNGYGPPPAGGYGAPGYPAPSYAAYRLSPDQLENLLAPVALYPDPVLAQVLIAATFVDQVQNAAGWMRRYNDPNGVDYQPWDISVKAVAHYPPALFMLADRPDWTTALGQAYIEQPGDVTAAIQHLRWMARNSGNLVTNDYWEVVPAGGFIEIVPVRPQFIYVPVYEPDVVFIRPATFVFGPAFVIGPWLNCAWDWGHHRIYYHGWRGGPRWVERSRPFVRVNNIYVNDRFRTIRVNRDVVRRTVNVQNLNRFSSVHRDTNFASLERRNAFVRERGNAITNDRRGRDDFRGRQGNEALRGRQGANQPAPRDDRGARFRQDRPAPTLQNSPQSDERSRRGRDDRTARANQDRAVENSRRGFNDRGAFDNRAQLRPEALENRNQRRDDNRRQSFGNSSPSFENRDARPRGERSQAFENRGRGNENRSRISNSPAFEPSIQRGRGGERRADARTDRARGDSGSFRAPEARGNADARRPDRADRRNDPRI